VEIKRVLCVCYGNSDRSPAMEAILRMFLKVRHPDVVVDSAGAGETAAKGGQASIFAAIACNLIGLDLIHHNRRRTTSLDMESYDLIICADDMVVALLLQQGVSVEKIYNANIPSGQWPFKFQEDYNRSFERILPAMFTVVTRYFV